jgi:hypothetical protein
LRFRAAGGREVSDIRSPDLTSRIHVGTVGHFRSTWQLGSRARSGQADYRVDSRDRRLGSAVFSWAGAAIVLEEVGGQHRNRL